MFTLPVSTAALAGWPMLYGTTTLAGLWVAAALIALRPSGVPAPLIWPALFAAAFIAWLQVFAWMPYGLPGLRMIVAVLWLTTIDAVVFTAMELEVRESLMVAIMAPQVPLAYLAARYAVGRARRGDTPDWRAFVLSAGPDRRRPSPPARTLSLGRPRPGVVRVAAARSFAARLGGHPRSVRAPLLVRRSPRAARPDHDRARRHAAHAALPGRLRGGDGRAVEPGREQRLRPDAVRGHATPEHRGDRRRQAEDGAGEHALRVAPGPGRRPAGDHGGRPLAGRGRGGPRVHRLLRGASRDRRRAAFSPGTSGRDVEAARAGAGHRPDRPRGAHQVERPHPAVVARPDRAHRPPPERQPGRADLPVERRALDPRRPGLLQDVRRGLDRHPPPSRPAARRPRARDRRRGLARRRARALRRARLDPRHAALRALLPDAPGHPGRPPGAAVRRPAGPRVEPASRNGAARPERARVAGDRPSARRSSCSSRPWRWPWSCASPSTSATGTTAASCPRARSARTGCTCRRATTPPGPRRSSSACTAGAVGGRSDGDEPVERGGRRAGVPRGLPVRRRRRRSPALARGRGRQLRARTSASSPS